METLEHPYPAHRIRVIHTKGSDLDIGRQHGEAVKDTLSVGMSRFYLDFWRRMMKTSSPGLMDGIFLELGKLLVDPVLVGILKRNVPEWAVDRLKGMSESSRFGDHELLATLILPDLMPLLQAYLGVVRPSALIEAAHPPRFGCTSFFVKGNRFYQGRNLDFPGVSYWDRYPIIQLYEKPGKLKYIGFSTAGVPIAGITGINEAQMMVALHQHYSRATSLRGTLPFVIAEKILEEATTLEEAREILKDQRVASSWAFIVSDGKIGEGFLQECDAEERGHLNFREAEEVFAHSNFFQTANCQRREYATTARMNWDNYFRKHRLEILLAKEGGKYSVGRLVKVLSDHFDPYWGEEKTVNRTISQVYNIQSLLVDVTSMKAYMAEGNSPIHLREYVGFDLGKVFSRQEGRTEGHFEGYRFTDREKERAKIRYILSFVAAFDGSFEKAKEQVAMSLTEHFTPEAALVSAILSLKAGDYTKSLELLSQAKGYIENKKSQSGLGIFPPEYFEICLFLARTMDLMERRNEALLEYRTLASHADLEDRNVRRLAISKKPYNRKQLSRIIMPYSTYIPFE